jgi:hypothetical protein
MIGGIGEGLFAFIFLYTILLITVTSVSDLGNIFGVFDCMFQSQCLVGCNLENGYLAYIPLFIVVVLITIILVLAPKVGILHAPLFFDFVDSFCELFKQVPKSMMDAEVAARASKPYD